MGDNETLAALAAQVDDLRGKVAKLQGVVASWNARLETEGIGATLLLRTEVKHLAEQLDATLAEVKHLAEQLEAALSAHRLTPPPAPYWLRLDAAEHRKRLAELRSWVEEFLRVQYADYTSGLRFCWANHPTAIWELSTLMTEWLRVYGDEDNRDLSAALWWHERWLPGTLARLVKAIPCDEAGCRGPRPQENTNWRSHDEQQ